MGKVSWSVTDHHGWGKILRLLGCWIFQANPLYKDKANTTWGNFRATVITQFQVPTSKVKAEYEFMTRRQESSETFDEFLTAIRHMASDCEFGETGCNQIVMQIIFGTRDSKGQQLCLQMPAINVHKAIHTLRMEELADTTAQKLEGHHTHHVDKIQQRPDRHRPNKPQKHGNDAGSTSKPCMGCGSNNHKWRDEKCPARGQLCNFCSKPDHFTKVCQKRQQQKHQSKRILHTAGGTGTKTIGTFQIHGGRRFQTLKLEADSGAHSTIIPLTVYNHRFWTIPLQTAPTQLL